MSTAVRHTQFAAANGFVPQPGSVDALLAHLAIANDLALPTTDRDFESAARSVPLRLWRPA
jgi:predicted nucleic acid-binding protein